MVDIKKSIKDGIKTFEAEINGEKIEWDEGDGILPLKQIFFGQREDE